MGSCGLADGSSAVVWMGARDAFGGMASGERRRTAIGDSRARASIAGADRDGDAVGVGYHERTREIHCGRGADYGGLFGGGKVLAFFSHAGTAEIGSRYEVGTGRVRARI